MYDPFGVRLAGGAAPSGLGFCARYMVEEESSGLLQMGVRFYDPQIGRFTSPDPIGLAGGDLNLYRYVANGVTEAADPSGLGVPF